MTQAHAMHIALGCDFAGIAIGLAAIVALMFARGDRPGQTTPELPMPGVVGTGFRFCRRELRTTAVILHADGTAHCLTCGTTIPTPEATDA